jgi:hypothetical protein
MSHKETEAPDKPAHTTKVRASFSWRSGIQIETEGFNYEQSEALLKAFISSRRIAAYWLLIAAVMALTAFLGGNLSEIVKAFSQPP